MITIIGYGTRGQNWARCAVKAGWNVRVFDPNGALEAGQGNVVQHELISTAVTGTDWIVLCLPDRLALFRKVIQHIQTICTAQTALGVMSDTHTAQELQGCAKWPGAVVQVDLENTGRVRLNITEANSPAIVRQTEEIVKSLGYLVEVAKPQQVVSAPGLVDQSGRSDPE